jgi:hypothetical protein
MARPTEAFVTDKLFELGTGTVVLTRFRGGNAECGVFLLDVFCLGVKNALYALVSESEYEHRVLDRTLPLEQRKSIDPPSARKLVEGAVAYARSFGFAPHADYKKAARVFGGTNAAESTARYTFGKNGKPLYVHGESDPFAKCLRILKQLRGCCGDDGFDFVAMCSKPQKQLLESTGIKIRQEIAAPPPGVESAEEPPS